MSRADVRVRRAASRRAMGICWEVGGGALGSSLGLQGFSNFIAVCWRVVQSALDDIKVAGR